LGGARLGHQVDAVDEEGRGAGEARSDDIILGGDHDRGDGLAGVPGQSEGGLDRLPGSGFVRTARDVEQLDSHAVTITPALRTPAPRRAAGGLVG
jgi:hypothetical protein